jgi:hypothetical protein
MPRKGRYSYPKKEGEYPEKEGTYPKKEGEYPEKEGTYPEKEGTHLYHSASTSSSSASLSTTCTIGLTFSASSYLNHDPNTCICGVDSDAFCAFLPLAPFLVGFAAAPRFDVTSPRPEVAGETHVDEPR